MSEQYIIAKLSEIKLLEGIIREEIIDNDSPHSYVFSDARYRLRQLEDFFGRIRKEQGADILEISDELKKMEICVACEGESMEHTCQSIYAQKLGRRLKRLIDRADNKKEIK